MINGNIKGPIFPQDTIAVKGIRFPLYDITDTTVSGTIYQSKGMAIFPMAYVHLIKQD